MKVLIYDLETGPLLGHFWRITQGYINPEGIVHDTFLMSWSAKWRGSGKVYSQVLTPEEAIAQDDARIVEGIAELVREADYVVAHNIERFDYKQLNGRVSQLGLENLGPVQMIDTKKLAFRDLGVASTSLDYLADFFGIGRKRPMSYDDWLRAYRGDPKALRKMDRYCRHDTRLLAEVFERMLPYVRGVPRLVVGDGSFVCVYCGSRDLIKRGFKHTAAGTYQQWQCKKCTRYSREPTAIESMKPGLRPN